MNRTLDEYTPTHAPHGRDPTDASGRPVDHRPTPGAFGTRDDGFTMGAAIADPEAADTAQQTTGAVHHRAGFVPKPGAQAPTRPSEPRASTPTPAVEADAEATDERKGLLARVERAVWKSSIVHRLLERLVERQKRSAEHIEDWLESPGLFRH